LARHPLTGVLTPSACCLQSSDLFARSEIVVLICNAVEEIIEKKTKANDWRGDQVACEIAKMQVNDWRN
jgi:hypothetical protein